LSGGTFVAPSFFIPTLQFPFSLLSYTHGTTQYPCLPVVEPRPWCEPLSMA